MDMRPIGSRTRPAGGDVHCEVLVSVLISSHNYGRYLATAIDSALGQTHPDVEVVVVDDGSTDESREVIRSYGDRIVAVLKPQGGQVSALNTAFAHSRGRLVSLLDADDAFMPDKVERVVAAWRECPRAHVIQHQMQIADQDGRPRHKPFPRRVPHGDLRERVVRSGGWIARSHCSALTFTRAFAERLFPVPATRRVQTDAGPRDIGLEVDTYLLGPATLLGPIAAIQAPLCIYRIHGENRYTHTSPTELMLRYRVETDVLRETMRERLGDPVALSVEDHLEYQLVRCAAGELSRPAAVRRVLFAPGLPAAMRPREALRVVANRGLSARRTAGTARPA